MWTPLFNCFLQSQVLTGLLGCGLKCCLSSFPKFIYIFFYVVTYSKCGSCGYSQLHKTHQQFELWRFRNQVTTGVVLISFWVLTHFKLTDVNQEHPLSAAICLLSVISFHVAFQCCSSRLLSQEKPQKKETLPLNVAIAIHKCHHSNLTQLVLRHLWCRDDVI